jgi:hypothetical protein
MRRVFLVSLAVSVTFGLIGYFGGVAAADPPTCEEADQGDNRHPSGNDRSCEQGRSGEQGGSRSDPDDDGRGPDRSNGGADRLGGAGGLDGGDQDANNGCGNDDDFEDDNEGLCLGPEGAPGQASDVQARAFPTGAPAPGNLTEERPEVEADEVTLRSEVADEAEVLGVRQERGAEAGGPEVLGVALPTTGAPAIALAILALDCLILGAWLLRRDRILAS